MTYEYLLTIHPWKGIKIKNKIHERHERESYELRSNSYAIDVPNWQVTIIILFIPS